MSDDFLQVGKSIRMEIDMNPSCASFRGVIHNVNLDTFIVNISDHYVQKGPRVVKCTIFNDNNTRICLFDTIIKYAKNGRLLLGMPNKDNIKIVQRRDYIRVPVDKEANCYLIGINDRKIESNKIFPAKVKDISGGGVLLNSSLFLPPETVLVFEMQLGTNKFLLTIKVLRTVSSEDDGTINLGCKFIGIDDGNRQMIIAYCNKEQLILKRRSKRTG